MTTILTTLRRGVLLSLALGGACLMHVSSAHAWYGPVDPVQIAYACQNGNPYACNALMQIARQECLTGNPMGCRVAAQLAGRDGGIAEQDPSFQPYNQGQGSPYAQNPLAPYRGLLGQTNDYIRSYCSNPRIAAQLRGFNYCN